MTIHPINLPFMRATTLYTLFTTKIVQKESPRRIFDMYLSNDVFPQINNVTKIKT